MESIPDGHMSPNQLPSPIWICDPVFGVVHPSQCTTCISYMRHVASASQSNADNTSFRLAIRKRDSQSTARYLDGFSQGMRLQSPGDGTADIHAKYRAERDQALERLKLRDAQIAATEKELFEVKQQFAAIQAYFDTVARPPTAVIASEPSQVKTTLPDLIADELDAGDIKTRVDIASRLPTPPPSPPPPPPPPPLSPLSPSSDLTTHFDTSPLEHDSYSNVDQYSNSPTVEELAIQTFPASAAIPTIQELMMLLSEARSGAEKVHARLDMIFSKAKSTPKAARAESQEFILLEWTKARRPVCPAPSVPALQSQISESTPVPLPRPGIPEIFVDSSAWGIGFIFNGRWLAWRLRPGWKDHGRDNNWAEMVAVELGLLVVVAAGFSSLTVVIRSDNTGVVEALRKKKSKHPRQPEVIERIEALAKSHGICLEMEWVSTKLNPADGPSRGELPSAALRFPSSPTLPAHLTPFLTDLT